MTTVATEMSPVECAALEVSPFRALYAPREKIQTITVANFPALGRLAAMRFLEWAQDNPGGTVSLPTGKTPEHFISWVTRMLATWDTPDSQKILLDNGVNPVKKPDMKSLHFVQIDEFYPIHSAQHNSFYHYVNKFYIDGFGMDRNRALLIDCDTLALENGETLNWLWPEGTVDLSLRTRQAKNAHELKQQTAIHRIDQWCQEYEQKIRALGGIGFFLGGIGPDGHIGFNVRGSDHYSATRLCETNYETQAAAATDLGGIEVSRKRLVITIGLGTIAFNPNVTALIIAAGEAKAQIVADAVQSDRNVVYPATALHGLKNARFYTTTGAAKKLDERRFHALQTRDLFTDDAVEETFVNLSVKSGKRIVDLSREDMEADRFTAEMLKKRSESPETAAKMACARLVLKVEEGSRVRHNTRFLHSEPHHDDVMLGYLPALVRHIRDASNQHFFATLTSGFTAVTSAFMWKRVQHLNTFLRSEICAKLHAEGYFDAGNMKGRNRDVWQYLDGVAANDDHIREEGEARRDLRNLCELVGSTDLKIVRAKMDELGKYLVSAYPGQKDPEWVQKLKGMYREWEAETLWGYFGWSCENVSHLRLGFYTGDIFTQEPTMERDVPPVLKLLEDTRPDIVAVALDPEASGPDTHYKVMQATSAALNVYAEKSGRKDITIWGYRNVWFRFQPHEADLFVPVSLNSFAMMDSSFLNTFISQKNASFPSYEHDGPFCELAQKIQVEQYQRVKTCLGREWFHEHASPLIRAARGLVFLKELKLDAFSQFCRQLRKSTEAR
jgi:glucosamine-6-phosphate deaminase